MYVSNIYDIIDIRKNKIILIEDDPNKYYDENTKDNYLVLDMNGNILFNTTALDIFENMYLIKNNNNKMILVDLNLNIISNEYDRIITNMGQDVDHRYSSYY